MKKMQSKMLVSAVITLLMGSGGAVAGGSGNARKLVVMLKGDVESNEPHQIDSAVLNRFQAETGVLLKWTGNTRTNAQLLQLPAETLLSDAEAIAKRIGAKNGVLWTDVREGSETAAPSALATQAGDEKASIDEFIIKLKAADIAAGSKAQTVDQFSAAAGVAFAATNELVGEARVYRLAHAVTAAQAADIERHLEALPEVRYADAVKMAKAMMETEAVPVTPDDEFFYDQWYLKSGVGAAAGSANVQAAWSLTTGSPDVTVAVVDSGILFRPPHPDLESKLSYKDASQRVIDGWDMISNPQMARDGNPRDKNPKNEGDWCNKKIQEARGMAAMSLASSVQLPTTKSALPEWIGRRSSSPSVFWGHAEEQAKTFFRAFTGRRVRDRAAPRATLNRLM